MLDHVVVFTAKEQAEYQELERDATLQGDEILVMLSVMPNKVHYP